MERERVRAEVLRQRDGLVPEVRAVFSRQIADSVMRWIQSESFDAVMLYLSMRSEVETVGLLERLLHAGKQVCAPVVDTEQNRLIPRRIQEAETALVRHRYGMLNRIRHARFSRSRSCNSSSFPVSPLIVKGIASATVKVFMTGFSRIAHTLSRSDWRTRYKS